MDNKITFDTPAILSLIVPGMGQAIKKHYFKAIFIWLVLFVLFYLGGFWKFSDSAGMWVGCFIGWVYNVYDAYNAKKDMV